MNYMKNRITWGLRLLCAAFCILHSASFIYATERTILIGPKTIGPGWKDNILLESRHFQHAQAGDVLTVYTDLAKRTAQGAFQDPQTWQGVAPEYGCFNVKGPFRMTLTDDILSKVRERGCIIGGHDYRILRVTLTPGDEFTETIVWHGPALQMKPDWSASAELPGKCLRSLQVGDALRLHVTKVQEGAAAKLMDFTWNALEPATDGIPVGSNGCTYYINDDVPLLKLQLSGMDDHTAMRIGGTGFRLEKVGIVKCTASVSDDLSQAQHAPKEYKLQPGELFHGEKSFPDDWSGNLRLTAEPFQECTENDVIVVSYDVTGETPQMSFRENKGKWSDITGAEDPIWYALDGQDVVLTFDDVSLDRVKTSGLVVTGRGFLLKRIMLISAQM